MKKISLYILTIFFLLAANYAVYGQTASVTAGCAELKVDFTAPQAASYFWRFGDGAASVSTLQNPEHSYIQPGTYTAQLFDQEGGVQVGNDITITVYPPIMFEINADARTGCVPLEVNFTSTLEIHPDIVVEDIVWTFGDGNSASGQNTNYTYEEAGVFTVSVKVITNASIKCDEPVIFEDYIEVQGERARFFINRLSSCDTPADFLFTNATESEAGTTFLWDFGNGETSTEEGPHNITYDAEGLFFPTLTTTSPIGCESTQERTISLGDPTIVPTFPDTVCLNGEVRLSQTTLAQNFIWDFTGTSIDTTLSSLISNLQNPLVTFVQPGLQTFSLTAIALDGCETTVMLDVFVFQANASYTLGPDANCTDPVFIEYTANDPNLFWYTFNNDYLGDGEDITRNSPTGANLYEQPVYDPYHINIQDSLSTRLVVVSPQGCTDTAFANYFIQKPEAFFIPDTVKGCIPFEVTFSDFSFSDEEIIIREWDFGDGVNEVYGTNDTIISHIYNTTGIHEAVLTVTDVGGCRDVSREVQIIAIDKEIISAPPGPPCTDVTICVGDTLSYLVSTDQVNANLHIESDDGRFNHCWRDQLATHAFQYPGVFPLNATFEFFTIYIDSLVTGCDIIVEGARSDIDYTIDCSEPFTVNLTGENSINADQYIWFVEDQFISLEESLTYTFPERGEYMVYLETSQNGVDCRHRDSALIHITDIKANILIPDKACASSPTPLDASASQDVYNKCHAGFKWIFENQRPREVNDSILLHTLLPGPQTITLVVEDINGCTDTISSTTKAFDLTADFATDSLICLPSERALTDFSIGDTSIVDWSWNFGGSTSDLQNPVHEFDTTDFYQAPIEDSLLATSILVTLIVEDALGCTDSTAVFIETFEISSELFMDNGPRICQNEIITFDAADYNLSGSFLTYEWDFGVNGSSNEDMPSVVFTESGDQLVTLTYTEDATGCEGTLDTVINVLPTPEASFITDQDSAEFICFPEQIQFTNTSIVEAENAFYMWDFGNGDMSEIEDPLIAFDKGSYEVQLIILTQDGCSDTTTQTYVLVGPEGDFSVDKENICPGEEITFTLENPVDLFSYTWDFGDGVQIDDQSPVTHIYDPQSSVNMFTPTLILRSDDNGCELIQNIPINVSSISANFTDTTGICPGEISFLSEFVNPQTIEWNIDGQIITGDPNPSVAIQSDRETFEVELNVTDANGCQVKRVRTIANPELGLIQYPNVFSPNGDALNANFNVVYDQNAFAGELNVVEFKVYNRWGELLYNNENPALGWDGRYKGDVVPADIYAYFIEVSIDGCSLPMKKGNVTVIK